MFRIQLMVVMLLAVAGQVQAADSSACYSIGNADARAYCLAKAHRNSSGCYSIQSSDLRAQCLAEVR